MNEFYTVTDHFVLLPAILLALFGTGVLVLEAMLPAGPQQRRWLLGLTLTGLAFTAHALFRQQEFLIAQRAARVMGFRGDLVVDQQSLFFNWLFLAASAVVVLASYRYLEVEGEHRGEYYGLLLLAQCGMYLLAGGEDLVTLFVGLELMAVCFYILVGFLRGTQRSNEAAVKYLLLGAFSSGFLAYGFSLLYGLAGSTLLSDVQGAMAGRPASDPLLVLALATTFVGLLFKISAAPFHMWAPDAYEGAPTPVSAYLSVASKTASFALLLRILLGPLAPVRAAWEPLLAVVAVVSLTIGNLAAIGQSNVKRLLAYSSVAHAGYVLLGLVAGNDRGLQGVTVYLLVYTFMNLGAFLVVAALRRQGLLGEDLADFAGLARRSPAYAALMLVFLLALAGVPPTAGFWGKYYIFLALLETGHIALAVAAVVFAVVSLYYYFRVARTMFSPVAPEPEALSGSLGLHAAVGVNALLTVGIGLYPEPFLRWAKTALGV